ncbi:amidohydrolase family protein [Limibacter armeniacum]|uniref:amidohydrolase family protein n=1 Tax=Limibacter armeniacum TaxID=466084 RepID=UPI002FE59E3A
MIKRLSLLGALLALLIQCAFAQVTKPVNGVVDNRAEAYAFTNATIFVDYQTKLESSTLVIRNGKVEAVGQSVLIPADATVIDLKGKFIYPSFIDMHTHYGLAEPKKGGGSFFGGEQIQSKKEGAYNANESVKAEFAASELFKQDSKEAEALRKQGFGTVLSFQADGVVRGTSSLVTLADDNENLIMLNKKAAAHYAFDKGTSRQMYPVSVMGYAALLRQTYMDAAWYKESGYKEFKDLSLEAFNAQQGIPQIFDANDLMNTLRADKIGDEFGVQYIIKGDGSEYQRMADIKATNAPLVVPVDFPEAYDVDDPYEAMMVTVGKMKHWEMAPTNLSMLENNGITFAITADGLKKKDDFLKNIRKAIQYGLSEQSALKAMTLTPAQLLKADGEIGSLAKGKVANFLIASGNIFEKDTDLYDNWVQGKRYKLKEWIDTDFSGVYALEVADAKYMLEVSGKPEKPSFKIVINDSTEIKVDGSFEEALVSLRFQQDTAKASKGMDIRLSGWVKDQVMKGEGQLPDGSWVRWSAKYEKSLEEKEKKEKDKKEEKAPELGKVMFPFVAFGNEAVPTQQTIIFTNATVWTNESEGIMENTDVMVKDGKIAKIGQGLKERDAVYVDATGKHLTSGIIDEHSHIALSAVNDVDKMSSMVRMADAVDPTNINIYRQLAGGVTAAQLLHGSANPVGGQSALVKLRWGKSAEEMLISGADKYIKFALGENVKRSAWSSSHRYPQTRMGVEQVYMDGFTRAKAYDEEWKAYNALPAKVKAKTAAPRRDLQLEALAEILNGERFISCHSYVQSEINMLMKVAEKFGFRVNTFTHILEGYKVADKMHEHGVGASTFADWWAYKFEVYEAIPYNAALMTQQGVTTAINSDDAEMARRLNQEAAKVVKYGGLSEEEVWKMVTLNPAKLLHLDDRMGSVKVGKDADLVLWTDNPLSIYAKAEKTLVDGVVYYDMEQDLAKREAIRQEKARITMKMKAEKKAGAPTRKPTPTQLHDWHCTDIMFNEASAQHGH